MNHCYQDLWVRFDLSLIFLLQMLLIQGISDDDMADEGAAQSSWGIGSDDDDDKEEMVTVSKKSLAKIHSQLKQLQQQLEIE